MNALERRNWLETFVAWGDPRKARLALVALEEGGAPLSDEKEIEKREGFPPGPLSSGTPRYWFPTDTAQEVSERSDLAITERMQNYLSDELQKHLKFNKQSNFALEGNLFPLKRPTTGSKWGKTVNLLGFKNDVELNEYYNSDEMLDKRLICMLDLFKRMKGRNGAIVFMGVQNYMDKIMNKLLPGRSWRSDIDESLNGKYGFKRLRKCIIILRTDPICCFVQHPSRGWFNKQVADALAKKLASLM